MTGADVVIRGQVWGVGRLGGASHPFWIVGGSSREALRERRGAHSIGC